MPKRHPWEDAPPIRRHRVVYTSHGVATYPDGVRPWFHHHEEPPEELRARPGDVFHTDDLRDVVVCLPGTGQPTIIRRGNAPGQPDAKIHKDGTLSVGEVIVKTVLHSRETHRFRIDHDRLIDLL